MGTRSRPPRISALAAAWLALLAAWTAGGDQAADVGLWDEALKGSLPGVEKYLDEGADPNFYWTQSGDAKCDFLDDLCGTSLLAAAWGNKAVVLQNLVDAGADANVLDGTKAEGFCSISSFEFGTVTPLYVALASNNTFATEVLLEAKANPDIPCGGGRWAPLPVAALAGTKGVFDLLLAAQPDVDIFNEGGSGDTALHAAFKREAGFEEQNEFAVALLAANASVNIPNLVQGDRALHAASRAGNIRGVELILEAGGDPALRNNAGLMPAEVACLSISTGEVLEGCDGDGIKAVLESSKGGEEELDCENPADSAEELKCALEGGNGTAQG